MDDLIKDERGERFDISLLSYKRKKEIETIMKREEEELYKSRSELRREG